MALTCGVDNSFTFGSDPNNASSISAVALYGAIHVSWNYPTVNSHAVAHVNLLRGTSAAGGSQLSVVKGSSYRDSMSQSQAGTTYYYWIQLVSVNGTQLALVGPASATAGDLGNDTASLLAGRIDNSLLAAALRTEIEKIPTLRSDLLDETTGRLNALLDIEDTLAGLGLEVGTTFAQILTEQNTRIDGDNINASQISAIAVSNGQNLAAIITEQAARVSAIDAEASQRELLGVSLNDNIAAAIDTERLVRVDAEEALASQISSVSTQAINTFRQASAPTENQGRRVDSLWFDTDDGNRLYQWNGSAWVDLQDQGIADTFAAIQSEQTARTTQYDALASDVTDVEASVTVINGQSIPTLTSDISGVAGDLSDYQGQVPTLISANVQNSLTAQVGYCLIGGAPSIDIAHDTKSECENAGGQWLALRQIAQAVKGVQVSDGDGSSNIEAKMSAYRNELGELNSQYTVKIQQHANGNYIAGGFGLSVEDGGTAIDAGFDVDTFWIGRVGDAPLNGSGLDEDGNQRNRYPFIIEGNDVYIKSVFIRDAAITNAKIGNAAITNAKIGNAEIDTLKVGGEAISVTRHSSESYVNMIIYDTSGGGYFYRHTTAGGDHSDVLGLIANTGLSNSLHSHQLLLTPGLQGATAKFVVSINCSIGIKCRNSIETANVMFYPRLLISRDNQVMSNKRLPPICINVRATAGVPFEIPYAVTHTFELADGGVYEAEVYFYAVDFEINDDFGSSSISSYDSNYLHYAYVRNTHITCHVFKR